jgi:hypothetical protein
MSRSGEALLARISDIFRERQINYAATGLAAAWKLLQFVGFRTVTFYLANAPGEDLLEGIGFREVDRGANVWLVLPNDEGVLTGSTEYEQIVCASPVQVYLDLKGHPERAREAADMLRAKYMSWSARG